MESLLIMAAEEKSVREEKNVLTRSAIREPFAENKFIFECVGLAANFRSSLAPWPLPMVARSRHKNLRRFLFKFMNLFSANGINYKAVFQ